MKLHPPLYVCAALLVLCLESQAQPQPEYVFPTTPFDVVATRLALEPGTTTLRGVVSAKSSTPGKGEGLIRSLTKSYRARKGTTVTLFPATPYFTEWHALRKKHQKGDKLAVMSPLAYSHRILTKVTADDGSFEFRNLKPGKYYLEASVAFTKQLSQRVQTGTEIVSSYGNISVNPVYSRQYYLQGDRNLVEEFIEIPAGRDVVEVSLK